MSITAYIGIGANLGDARANVEDAIGMLRQLHDSTLAGVSSLYLTAPIDSSGDDYINAVARLQTTLEAEDLLAALQNIEQAHGRLRPYRNAPRTLDLDLLLYGEQIISSPHLSVPHPRMTERAFVLVPLHELDAQAHIPGHGVAADHLPRVADQAITQLKP